MEQESRGNQTAKKIRCKIYLRQIFGHVTPGYQREPNRDFERLGRDECGVESNIGCDALGAIGSAR